MSTPAIVATHQQAAKLVIPPIWHKLPLILVCVGGAGGLIGAFTPSLTKQFAYSYLLAYMFFLSLCLGAMFLTILHHLFDANWTVPVRRVTEHMAFLLPVMAALFLPIALLAPSQIYNWMRSSPAVDHALHAKQPFFTLAGFYCIAVFLFALWWWLAWRLRYWSILQDKATTTQTGEGKIFPLEQFFVWLSGCLGDRMETNNLVVLCSRMMRFHAGYGIYAFALSLTLAAIMWMKALEHQWFSTMYGVYYFAASVWITLGTLYLMTTVLGKSGPLNAVVRPKTLHDMGVLWLAFTVFYAYIHFSQYFLIWNADIPEETFYYAKREVGSWWQICLILVFGHFLVPFLLLLRIDFKLNLAVMIPLCIWAWMMHFCDISFNVMPLIHDKGFVLHPLDLTCMAFIGGVLAMVFLKFFRAHPPYPVNDPRLGESLGLPQTVPATAPPH